jgi:hypothetical protein
MPDRGRRMMGVRYRRWTWFSIVGVPKSNSRIISKLLTLLRFKSIRVPTGTSHEIWRHRSIRTFVSRQGVCLTVCVTAVCVSDQESTCKPPFMCHFFIFLFLPPMYSPFSLGRSLSLLLRIKFRRHLGQFADISVRRTLNVDSWARCY